MIYDGGTVKTIRLILTRACTRPSIGPTETLSGVLTWDINVDTTVGATAAPSDSVCIVIILVDPKHTSKRNEWWTYLKGSVYSRDSMTLCMWNNCFAVTWRSRGNATNSPAIRAPKAEQCPKRRGREIFDMQKGLNLDGQTWNQVRLGPWRRSRTKGTTGEKRDYGWSDQQLIRLHKIWGRSDLTLASVMSCGLLLPGWRESFFAPSSFEYSFVYVTVALSFPPSQS